METLKRTFFIPIPKNILAAYVEKAGTYQLEDMGEVTVESDDVYLTLDDGTVAVHTGVFFRNKYQKGFIFPEPTT